MNHLFFHLLSVLIAYSMATRYKNCGSRETDLGQPRGVELRSCPTRNKICNFKKGSKQTIKISFKSNTESKKYNYTATAVYDGAHLSEPLVKVAGCKPQVKHQTTDKNIISTQSYTTVPSVSTEHSNKCETLISCLRKKIQHLYSGKQPFQVEYPDGCKAVTSCVINIAMIYKQIITSYIPSYFYGKHTVSPESHGRCESVLSCWKRNGYSYKHIISKYIRNFYYGKQPVTNKKKPNKAITSTLAPPLSTTSPTTPVSTENHDECTKFGTWKIGRGLVYEVPITIQISNLYPTTKADIKIKIGDENKKEIVCVQIAAQIQ